MAQITWRDVATPDFSSAANGFAQFSRILGDATSGLSRAVGNFDKSKSDLVRNQLALAIAQAPNAEAVQQAVASGRIGSLDLTDPGVLRRLDPESLKAISPDTLIQQQLDTTRLAGDKLRVSQDQITADQRKVRDDQASLFAQADALERAGKTAEAAALRSQANYNGFGYGAVAELNKAVQSTQATALDYDRGKWSLGNDKEDRSAETAGIEYAAKIAPQATSVADLQFLLNSDPEFQKLSGRAQEVARRKAVSALEAIGAANGISAGSVPGISAPGSSGGGDFSYEAPQQAVAGVFKAAGMSDAVAAGFLGNFQVEGGYTGAKGDGGSAAGIAQWRNERRQAFIQRNGIDPSKAPADLQAKHVLWELTTAEGRKVAGLTKEQADAILNAKDPGQAAELIDRFYERSDGTHRARRVSAAQAALNVMSGRMAAASTLNQYSQTNANSMATDWAAAAGNTGNITDVATGLLKTDFAGKGVDRGVIAGYLQQIQARGKKEGVNISPAEAAAILKNSIKQENFFERWAPGEALGGGTKVDWKAVDGNLKDIKSGAVQKVVVANQVMGDVQATAAAALAQQRAAEQELLRVQRAAMDNPRINPAVIARAERNVELARQAYQAAVMQQQASTPNSMKPALSPQEQLIQSIKSIPMRPGLIPWGS